MELALRSRYSITCTCSLVSSLPRCLDHQAPPLRLPPLMMIGTALDPERGHDGGANRTMLGQCRFMVGAHRPHFVLELAPLAAVQVMGQLVEVAALLAHL